MPANKVSARELIGQVFDADSFESWDTAPLEIDPDPKYRAELDAAAEKSGADESVLTGTALLGGRRVAVIACEFSFLAGSIGVAAAERIVTAIERATTRVSRCSRRPPPAAPACRRARSPSCRW